MAESLPWEAIAESLSWEAIAESLPWEREKSCLGANSLTGLPTDHDQIFRKSQAQYLM